MVGGEVRLIVSRVVDYALLGVPMKVDHVVSSLFLLDLFLLPNV